MKFLPAKKGYKIGSFENLDGRKEGFHLAMMLRVFGKKRTASSLFPAVLDLIDQGFA